MNIVENQANTYFKRMFDELHHSDFDGLKSNITMELYNFNRDRDKLDFLNVLRKAVNDDKNIHEEKCNKKGCVISLERNNALFIIDQEIEDILKDYEKPLEINDEFSPEEISNLHTKLNEIIDRLENLSQGQEVIFNEIDELREYFKIGKKNWFQLLKGKLIDIAIDESLDKELLKEVFDYLSDGYKVIKGVIAN